MRASTVVQDLEGYARLPEDLLQDLLQGAETVVQQVSDLLAPAIDRHEALRAALEDLGLVRRYSQTDPETICGVDGGYAVERTAAVDLVLSVAVGVEGLSQETTQWDGTQYQWWTHVSKHDLESERLGRGVMVAQELAILSNAPHQLRILDGSHLTLVIQLNSSLTMYSQDLRREARRVWDRLDTRTTLREVAQSSTIIAMPKYDSSRVIADQLERRLGEEIPGDDKYLLGLLLQPGEVTVPQRVPENPWRALHFDARAGDEDLARDFQAAIAQLTGRHMQFLYFKPSEFSPAFRVEIKEGRQEQDIDSLCTTLSAQMTGPFIREPYPQYLADVMAKSVGLGLTALQSAVQLALSGLGRPEIAELLLHSYRTEGM
jgi:hypothetical protein